LRQAIGSLMVVHWWFLGILLLGLVGVAGACVAYFSLYWDARPVLAVILTSGVLLTGLVVIHVVAFAIAARMFLTNAHKALETLRKCQKIVVENAKESVNPSLYIKDMMLGLLDNVIGSLPLPRVILDRFMSQISKTMDQRLSTYAFKFQGDTATKIGNKISSGTEILDVLLAWLQSTLQWFQRRIGRPCGWGAWGLGVGWFALVCLGLRF